MVMQVKWRDAAVPLVVTVGAAAIALAGYVSLLRREANTAFGRGVEVGRGITQPSFEAKPWTVPQAHMARVIMLTAAIDQVCHGVPRDLSGYIDESERAIPLDTSFNGLNTLTRDVVDSAFDWCARNGAAE